MSDRNNGNSVVTKAHFPTTYSRKKHSCTQASSINGKEGTQRRNKRARTSPMSSGKSDTKRVNYVNCEQSGYQVIEHKYAMKCSEGDMQLSQRLEFQNKVVIIKNKRKPSRKRAITVTSEFPDQTDKQSASGIEIDKTEGA
ncbi:hypothetical protein Tco_0698598 [Tanacetum coccineum]